MINVKFFGMQSLLRKTQPELSQSRRSTDGQPTVKASVGASDVLCISLRTLRYAACMLMVLVLGIGQMWGATATYVPLGIKTITEDEVVYCTSITAAGTPATDWVVVPSYGTSSVKYTQITSTADNGNPQGLTDNLPTTSSNVNMIQIKADGNTYSAEKRVIHMHVKGITGVVAHGNTSSSNRGLAIAVAEFNNNLSAFPTGANVYSFNRTSNSGSLICKKDGLDASKEYIVSIYASGNDTRFYAAEFIAGAGGGCSAPTRVSVGGTWNPFVGETISLTATPSGGTGTPSYQWYKGGKTEGNKIAGATSATYTKANCTFEDAGQYYCKVSTGADCSTFSDVFEVKMLRLYLFTGDTQDGYFDLSKTGTNTASVYIPLGSNWNYKYYITDGCGHNYGNTGTMASSNCTNWTMNNTTTKCGITTTKGASYVFNVNCADYAALVVSVVYPSTVQTGGYDLYFANDERQWSKIHYRIGRTNWNSKAAMTLVPGTANLYHTTTIHYESDGGFEAWHIANNSGWSDGHSIYKTKTGDTYAITNATNFEGAPVPSTGLTVIPGSSHSTGGDDQNNNCEFYGYTTVSGLLTHNVAITSPTHGTISVAYTDVSGSAQSFTSGNRDLAHTVIITPKATPAEGYTLSGLTVNGVAHTSGTTYTVTANTTIAATFSPISYTVTLNTNGGTINAGNVTSYTYGTGATLPTNVTKSGFTFAGWYDNSGLTGSAVTTISTTATGNKEYWAKWEEVAEPECTPQTLFSMVVSSSASNYSLAHGETKISSSDSEISGRLTSISGGTLSIENKSKSSNKDVFKDNCLLVSSADVYYTIALGGGKTLQAGDIITVTTKTAYWPYMTKTNTKSNNPSMAKPGSSDPYTYTLTLANTNSASGKDLIGAGTLYLWKNSSDVRIHSITITRPCDESGETCQTPNITDVAATIDMTTAETKSQTISLSNEDALSTVTYAWTNADGTAIAAAANASGTNTFRLTLASPAAGTYNVKCTVTNDCGGETKTATSPTFTFRVTESTGCTEIAKVIVSGKDSGTGSGTKIAESSGYGVKLENTTASNSGNTGYKIGSSNYVYLQLASGEQFLNGDKVKVYITKLSDQGDGKLHIYQGTTGAGTEVATVETPALGWNEATLSGLTSGNRSLTIHRGSDTKVQNHYIYAFAVERCVDCTPASFEGLSYEETEYTVGASASAISVTNPENADSYQWYYNTMNDRSDATKTAETGATSASFTPSTAVAFGTRYYWCELTNNCGTVKTTAVAVTVSSSKSAPTVTWTNPSGVNYGGGGYTIRATVDQTAWDGTLTASMLTAPTGIAITDVTIGADASKKYIEVTFDVQTSFNTETYSSSTIPFVLSLPETTNYDELVSEKDLAYSACAGGGAGSSYNVRVRKNYDKDASNNYRWVTAGVGEITIKIGSSIGSNKLGSAIDVFDSITSSNTQYVWIKPYVANISSIRLYAGFESKTISLTNIYRATSYKAADSKDEYTSYTVKYQGDGDNIGSTDNHYLDISLNQPLDADEIILLKFSASKVKPYGAVVTEGSAGTLTTTLAFANAGPVNKLTSDANFTNTASVTGANSNTLGTISYSSDHPEIASVNATTGEVMLVAAGTAVITATLTSSGCYKGTTASYTINVEEVACEEPAGVIVVTSGSTEVCSEAIVMTLTHLEGATVQWYNGETEISNGGGYTITNPTTTTSVLSTTTPGNYSAKAYKDCEKAAAKRSNTIKVVSAASEVNATAVIERWYIKNGRPTPDIALWQLGEGTSLKSVAWSPANATGLTAAGDIYEQDGIVYLTGKEPSANESGADIEYTLTLTVNNSCGSETVMSEKTITIVHQKNTDKHVLAFVVTGKGKGGWTEGISANQTTKVGLYNEISRNFDVLATNIYSTDDEKKLKEYYSQFDILCITDYPNTGTKGVNGKSYVDAIGSLIDIRPILTMEAYVSGLANWRSKGVVGNRTTPSKRQYNMLLQCKDHEIFSGTSPETIGEGDNILYRVNMVDSTKSRYEQLDAVSKSSHASDTAALQGFTTGEMDLLALGLIDNGSGTDLQVGAERQKKMEARMMVLGINSYAMERLSDDGETVVINALRYLMKKNGEDIADCSNYFVGGTSGRETDWGAVGNWTGGTLPDKTQEVRILAPCEVKNGTKAHVARVKIVPDGMYHGEPVSGGTLTIQPGGALIVDGKVQSATAPSYYVARPTATGELAIITSATASGVLAMGDNDGSNAATVAFYTYARKENGKYVNHYFGTPFNSGNDVYNDYYNSWIYRWDASIDPNSAQAWVNQKRGTPAEPFVGYNILRKDAAPTTLYISGTLCSSDNQEIDLVKRAGVNTENVVANSWMAPIDIASMGAAAFTNCEATVYIFNAGTKEQYGGSYGQELSGSASKTDAGQYIVLPVGSAPWTSPAVTVIPSMQAFSVFATADNAKLSLDYDNMVLKPAKTSDASKLTTHMRAPKRKEADANKPDIMRMDITGASGYGDRLFVLIRGDFSEDFDNGYDGRKLAGDSDKPMIYAVSQAGNMAINCVAEADGMVVGFRAGDDSEYSITFSYDGGEKLYLNDLKLQQSTLISDENTYSFTSEEGDSMDRFLISSKPFGVATGVGNTQDDIRTTKVQKVIVNDKLYIIRGGRVYSADGAMVK